MKFEILNNTEIQKSKIRNQNDNSKRKKCSARLLPAAQLWQAG